MAARIVECSPMLRAKITGDKILFAHGSFIQALAADWRGAAGAAPTIVLGRSLSESHGAIVLSLIVSA